MSTISSLMTVPSICCCTTRTEGIRGYAGEIQQDEKEWGCALRQFGPPFHISKDLNWCESAIARCKQWKAAQGL